MNTYNRLPLLLAILLITAICASSTESSDKDNSLSKAWESFNSASSYEECAQIARDILVKQPESRYSPVFLNAVVEYDFYQSGKREETIAFVENTLEAISDAKLRERVELILLQLYGCSETFAKYSVLFDKLSARIEKGESLFVLARIASECQHVESMARILPKLESAWATSDEGKGWYNGFKAWYLACTGKPAEAENLFVEAYAAIPQDSYGYSKFDQLFLFWGKALILDNKPEEGIKRIAQCAFWTGNPRYLEQLNISYEKVFGSKLDSEKEYELRLKYAEKIKPFSAIEHEGEKFTNADLKNKLNLVLYWSSVCSPCHRQMVHQKDLLTKYSADELQYVAFSLLPNDKKDSAFIKENSLPFTFIRLSAEEDAMAFASKNGIKIFPTTLLVDNKGNILARFVNYAIGDGQKIENAIQLIIEHM